LETLERIRTNHGIVSGTGNDLKPLKEFVRIDERYAVVLEHLFAGAYLLDKDEDLEGHRGSGSEILITRSGLIYDNGRISGGSESDADGSLLVGREDRLRALEKELSIIEGAVISLKADSIKIEDDNKVFRSEICELEASAHTEEIALSNAAMKKTSEESSAIKIKEELELLASELAEADGSVLDLTKSGEALNTELNKTEAEKASAEAVVEESLGLVAARKAAREKALIEMATLAAELQSYGKEEDGVKNNLNIQEALAFGFEETLYAREAAVKDSIEKAGALECEIVRLSGQNGELTSVLLKLSAEAQDLEARKSDINDKFSIEELQLDEKKKVLESLKNQSRDLDVKLAELSYKKTNMKERIAQAYRIDLETVHIEAEENSDWEAFKNQVAELRERLEKMGPVNLVAIEEHKEFEERYSFLVHQQEDLVNAKDSLHKAIQKINKTTKDLFLDAFGKIQVEFKSFFRMLFGGGQAELVLIDEQDILESGIEIVVRPPGKKLQNLMLLSGGEKALTAISLLFAIFKVKPSPFCVLDEIDAPLDEANVLRFSNVLKDFLKISQFIIITHNKRTIELADVMYGITMQERGVSKIVSVKFAGSKAKEPEPPQEARTEALAA
jgi:chromosome segregation protein